MQAQRLVAWTLQEGDKLAQATAACEAAINGVVSLFDGERVQGVEVDTQSGAFFRAS